MAGGVLDMANQGWSPFPGEKNQVGVVLALEGLQPGWFNGFALLRDPTPCCEPMQTVRTNAKENQPRQPYPVLEQDGELQGPEGLPRR